MVTALTPQVGIMRDYPPRNANMTISREDVAEEILRVSTLPDLEWTMWFRHGVYLVDMNT